MIIKIILDFECHTEEESKKCWENIYGKIENRFGKLYDPATNTVSGHVSLSHVNRAHVLFVVTYDKTGVHESYRKGVTITKKSDKVIKYTGEKITQSEIKKLF